MNPDNPNFRTAEDWERLYNECQDQMRNEVRNLVQENDRQGARIRKLELALDEIIEDASAPRPIELAREALKAGL